MSLSVCVYVYDENGKKNKIELGQGNDLAGFEDSRHKLYGSKLAENLGLKLLPQLKFQDLHEIKGEQLRILENELGIIIENLNQFSEESGFEQDYIKARVQNILNAAQVAGRIKGVVYIW